MAKLFLICGFLGAGKTTFSKKLAYENNAEYMNVDEYVMQNFTKQEYENNWEDCFTKAEELMWQKIYKCTKNNQNVVFDVGFWTRQSRDEARNRALKIGITPVLYYIYAPDEILKQRIATRSGSIAENNIKNFDSIKQMFEVPQSDEDLIQINNY